jgi:hypothetical protein
MPVASEYQLMATEIHAVACNSEMMFYGTFSKAVGRSPLWHAVLIVLHPVSLAAHLLTCCRTSKADSCITLQLA